MEVNLSEAEIEEFNSLFDRGTAPLRGIVPLDGIAWRKPGILARRKLRKAIACLELALSICPSSWQTQMMLGKAFQALGDQEKSLDYFLKAGTLQPTNPSVAKEAGVSAGRLGKHELAAQLMRESAYLHPEDGALHTNLGLSYLLSNQHELAKKEIRNGRRRRTR